jgi:hypothetical protein
MALIWRVTPSLLLLVVVQDVFSARFKIAVPRDESDRVHPYFSKRNSAACTDYEPVSDPEALPYPQGFHNLIMPRPWVANPSYTSERVTQGINDLFGKKVPGLDETTIQEVIDILQENGCLSFPYGGSVRDQFLDATPADLDMETNCKPEDMLSICEENWGSSNCFGSTKVHIGNTEATDGDTDVIDAANWNETFFGTGGALEYTTNAMAYFADGLDIVIDLTGNGIDDTCKKHIRIPVDAENWQRWVETSKVYRFWKLRIKGYTAIDSDTKSYIVSEAKKSIQEDPNSFQSFYCKNALNGKWMSAKCEISKHSCKAALEKKKKYDNAFEIDLEEFWSDEAMGSIDGLEDESCSGASMVVTWVAFYIVAVNFMLGEM